MQTWVFYDGGCGLCHGAVLFLLARDPDGSLFRYAPLFGETFNARVPIDERASLPDSLVILTPQDRILQRASGVLHTLKRIGGFWGLVGTIGGWIPSGLADWGYDRIAAIRFRLFKRPDDACPVVPSDLRGRFAP